ncbi:MAG TPA: trehalase family glycosidase [Candidatus Saccharimonadales bacterium]|nr:trehalase family glycosidase [Candidatus Saccharimonadales bacterium]
MVAKNTKKNISLFEDIDKVELQEVINFIDSYWDRIIHNPQDSMGNPHIIPLPNPYITTNVAKDSHWEGAMFYWDTFFMFRGIVGTKRDWLLPKMVENYIYLLTEFGIIPNANKWAFLDRSQPPFLSSMIFDAYYSVVRATSLKKTLKKSYIKPWLKRRIEVAKKEYWNVWEDTDYYHHKVQKYGLSRYGDRDVGYGLSSELESGWDLTSRFYNRCNDFLPVDLNSYLHKYEKDFAKAAFILGNEKDVKFWNDRAKERHEKMRKLMWNEKEGFFFDYDYRNDLQSEFYSLAGFVPMWAKMASYDEAKRMVKKLHLFESDYGLTITSKASLPPKLNFSNIPPAYRVSIENILKPKQWDYPHIWPPLEYLTVIGLLRYGFVDDAVRIMKKSVKANMAVFKKYGALLEKIDAKTGEKPETFWYAAQLGFGWTNGVFFRYVKLLELIDSKQGDIYNGQKDLKEPPYNLNGIIH